VQAFAAFIHRTEGDRTPFKPPRLPTEAEKLCRRLNAHPHLVVYLQLVMSVQDGIWIDAGSPSPTPTSMVIWFGFVTPPTTLRGPCTLKDNCVRPPQPPLHALCERRLKSAASGGRKVQCWGWGWNLFRQVSCSEDRSVRPSVPPGVAVTGCAPTTSIPLPGPERPG
jgi:hypothetical protein